MSVPGTQIVDRTTLCYMVHIYQFTTALAVCFLLDLSFSSLV